MSSGGFGVENLPYGAFRVGGASEPRLGVRLEDDVVDLNALALSGAFEELGLRDVLTAPVLNPLLAEPPSVWQALRVRLRELVSAGVDSAVLHRLDDVTLCLPFAVGDYVDFYSSLGHAANLGRIFRPAAPALPAAWRYLPIGYHGRSGSVLVTGTDVYRPSGQRKADDQDPTVGPSEALDIELELGFVTGGPATAPGTAIGVDSAAEHIFGVVLVNDWSARDLQRWEYVPLGPFLGKSFATSISAWVVPLAALGTARTAGPVQDPPPLDYLREAERWTLDIELKVSLCPAGHREYELVSRTNSRDLYWTFAQQLAHASSNGAVVRPGDLFATGTISGEEPGSQGSFIELTWNGDHPLNVGGQLRTFLEDGDSVRITGASAGGRVSLGDVEGTILASPSQPKSI
jgi:fumarylacetoacetase